MKEKDFIKPDDAYPFMKRSLKGVFGRSDLDMSRNKDRNGQDFLMNQNIIYHTESILETQILCMCTIHFLQV